MTRHTASELVLEFHQLCHPTSMAATFEKRGKERYDNFLSEADSHDPGTDGQHVRIVVGSRHSSGVQIVAQGCSHSSNLVRCELLTLAASSENDPEIGRSIPHGATNSGTDRRVVATLGRVGSLVVHSMTCSSEEGNQMTLQIEARMIGTDGDAQTRHVGSLRRCQIRTAH